MVDLRLFIPSRKSEVFGIEAVEDDAGPGIETELPGVEKVVPRLDPLYIELLVGNLDERGNDL